MKLLKYFTAWLVAFILLTALNYFFHGVWAYSFFYEGLKGIIYPTMGDVHSRYVGLDYAILVAANLNFMVNSSGKNLIIQGMIAGGILGLVAFGTWNLVNYAFIPNWPMSIVVLDTSWHILVGIVSGSILGIICSWLKVGIKR